MDATDAVRDAEIRALELLSRPLPDVLTHLTRIAAQVTGASGARINIISADAQHTLVNAYGPPETIAREASMCARLLGEDDPQHLVPDARADDRFAQVPMVLDGDVLTYAANRLVTTHGVPIGTLCVYDPDSREITPEALDVLEQLAAAVMDILESRRNQDAVRLALADLADGTKELRRSNETLAAFAGQVSHDVQGPLAAVLMALQMMEELRPADAAPDRLLTSALSGAQRMRATISGLLDYAVLGGALARVELDMNEVVVDVLVDLHARLGPGRVEVDDLPRMWGDDVQVRAVTQNLVANALKYAGPEPLVRVSGEVGDGVTRLTVSDNGPGVPVERRHAIFDLYVRGDEHATTGVEGLGIGLATCARIVAAHGGRIGVGEADTGGAAFWFELPDKREG